MISRKNSSLIEVVYVGKIIMILFLTVSSCQRQVSCHKGDIEIIDVLNRNHPIEINLYDIVDSVKYVPLGTGECLLIQLDAKDANIESAMMCGEGELIAYYPLPNNYSQNQSEYSVCRIKNDSLIGETLLKAKEIGTQNIHYPFLHYQIALLDNQYFFISALSNELFVYEGGQIMPGYYVNIPENEPSEDFIEEHKDLNFFELIETLKKSNIGLGITAIESSSDYLFMSISNKSTLIWDKKRSIQISDIYDPDLNLYSDLLLSGGVSDEHLGFYSADFLCANKELILKGNDRSLTKLVGNLLEDDNPVVYQYYFKKNAIDILIEKYGI